MLRRSTCQHSASFGIGFQHTLPGHRDPRDSAGGSSLAADSVEGLQRRVSFYDYGTIHPAKGLAYFIVRHLRKIPTEWRNYYMQLYRSEFYATHNVNKNWDQFCYVHEGYRKAKWVLKKYGQEPNPNSIPEPYHSMWSNASHDERAWAYRRSFHLKELQALQRETCHEFGSIARDRSSTTFSHVAATQHDPMKAQTGTNVHSDDLPAPKERDIRDTGEMSEIYMMTIQDDRKWNPLLKKESVGDAQFWEFEDDDDDDEEDDGEDDAPAVSKKKEKKGKTIKRTLVTSLKRRDGKDFSSSSTQGECGADVAQESTENNDEEDDGSIDEADFAAWQKKQEKVFGARAPPAVASVVDTTISRPTSRFPTSKPSSSLRTEL